MTKEVARTKLAATAETPNIEEEIRKRAYELFQARGGVDWLRAEEEIRGSKTNVVAA